MRYFSYRNKLRLRSLAVTIAAIVLALLALGVGVFLYLQRFLVYTPTGVYLDLHTPASAGQTPLNPNFVVEPPTDAPLPPLIVEQPSADGASPTQLRKLTGVYITGDMLENPDALAAALAETGETAAVLLDVKSVFGNFYYSTHLAGATVSTTLDAARMDELIRTLAGREDVYLIARVPAFRDSAFALENQTCGLPLSSGALWLDAQSCYWLDPANDQVLTHLEDIALELRALGFDEIAFSDFYFPVSGNIAYDGDRAAAITEAARRLSANLKNCDLTVSFFSTDAAVAPFARRLYVENADGGELLDIAAGLSAQMPDPAAGLVFLTASHDTRFAAYSVLSPALPAAQ